MVKPQFVILVDAGSNPVAQPNAFQFKSALGIGAVHLAFDQATGVQISQGGLDQ